MLMLINVYSNIDVKFLNDVKIIYRLIFFHKNTTKKPYIYINDSFPCRRSTLLTMMTSKISTVLFPEEATSAPKETLNMDSTMKPIQPFTEVEAKLFFVDRISCYESMVNGTLVNRCFQGTKEIFRNEVYQAPNKPQELTWLLSGLLAGLPLILVFAVVGIKIKHGRFMRRSHLSDNVVNLESNSADTQYVGNLDRTGNSSVDVTESTDRNTNVTLEDGNIGGNTTGTVEDGNIGGNTTGTVEDENFDSVTVEGISEE